MEVRITGPRFIAALIVVLFAGIGIGTVVSERAAARNETEGLRISSDSAYPTALSTAFNAAAEAVESSVVHITTLDNIEGEAFSQNSGSGVIIDPSGYIITNHHVIKSANKIKIRFIDGSLLSGNVIGADEETDIAVVKVAASKPLKAARVGDSDRVMVGEWVLAIGSPFGLQQTVTAGIISAKERVTDVSRNFQQMLQTDAAINPGNSGGPLINMSGEVVGINTQIATRTGNFQGVGFAVPSTLFMNVYNQLLSNGRVSRGYLGIFPDKVTPEFARIYKIEDRAGALIHDLIEQSGPAARAGLKSGDVIIELDGYKIKDDRDLVRRTTAASLTKPVTVKYIRDGEILTTTVNLIERDSKPTTALLRQPLKPIPDGRPRLERPQSGKEKGDDQADVKLGISVAPLSELRAKMVGIKEPTSGVVLRFVETDGVAYDAGLRDGDLIKEVNKQQISNEDDFQKAIKKLKSGDPIVFFTERRARSGALHRFVSVTIP